LFIPDLYTEKTLDYKKITNALSDINDYIYKYNIIEDPDKLNENLTDIIEDLGGKVLSLDYIFYSLGQGGKPNKINKYIIKKWH